MNLLKLVYRSNFYGHKFDQFKHHSSYPRQNSFKKNIKCQSLQATSSSKKTFQDYRNKDCNSENNLKRWPQVSVHVIVTGQK